MDNDQELQTRLESRPDMDEEIRRDLGIDPYTLVPLGTNASPSQVEGFVEMEDEHGV